MLIQNEHKPIMSNANKFGHICNVAIFSAFPGGFFLGILYGIVFGIIWGFAEDADLKRNLELDEDMRFFAKCEQRMNLDELNSLMKKIVERTNSK